MSRQASPKLIGAFVLGALTLLAGGLTLLGGVRWLGESRTYIAYFPGSVKGLRIGAPVDFRGVPIGEVTDIRLRYDAASGSLQIPVLMELEPGRIAIVGAGEGAGTAAELGELFARGLRAQLQIQSVVTGLLFVQLDFFPNAPLRLVDAEDDPPEVPTIPSTLEQLEQTVAEIAPEVPELLRTLNRLLAEVSGGLGASRGDFERILGDLANVSASLAGATPAIERLIADSSATARALRASAETADAILADNREAIATTVAELQGTAVAVRRMADQVNNLVAENREGLQDFTARGLYEITGLAQDAQRMVDQITRIAEELERDPARFFFGDRTRGVAPEE